MAAEGKRSGLSSPAWIIALLAALGIGPALMAPHSPPAPAAAPSSRHEAAVASPPGSDEVPRHSAAELLENFLDTNPQEVNRAKPWSHDDQPAAGARPPLRDSRAAYRVEFLIATLPEPGSPPLRSAFDADLDAISFALGRAGYALASFDLPWLEDAGSNTRDFRLGGTIDLTPPGGSAPFELAPADDRRAEREPGVMLFHREKADETNRQLLVLFLVGESPTRGVNHIVLRDALEQISWLAGPKCGRTSAPPHLVALAASEDKTCAEIRIIGPSFSGSAVSMRDALEEWASALPPRKVRIISGAATAISEDELKLTKPAVEYFTLRVPDPVMLQSIERRFMPGPGQRAGLAAALERPRDRVLPERAPAAPIVILSENTIYGASFATAGKARADAPAAGGFLKIPFPLHISNLRTASGKDAAASLAFVPPVGTHNLPLPDEAGQQQQDEVPAFSNRSAVYDQLILQNLLQTIRAERARYVGVVATDVEDLIFLVREIRAYCPDVVVFTTSSDLLFTHSDFAPDLVGLLVFSTFPLFNSDQPWTNAAEAAGARVQFPNEDAEGVYNATLAQLDRPEWMLDYGEPFQGAPFCTLSSADLVGQLDPRMLTSYGAAARTMAERRRPRESLAAHL